LRNFELTHNVERDGYVGEWRMLLNAKPCRVRTGVCLSAFVIELLLHLSRDQRVGLVPAADVCDATRMRFQIASRQLPLSLRLSVVIVSGGNFYADYSLGNPIDYIRLDTGNTQPEEIGLLPDCHEQCVADCKLMLLLK